jgi:hypothetical protein
MRLDALSIACSLPVLGVVLALALGFSGRASVRSDVAACISRGCFDTEAASGLREIIAPFILGTRVEGKLNTTAEPLEEFLNVYVAKSKPPGRLESLSCNCGYIGDSTIICDQKFLSTFESTVNFTMNSFYGKDAKQIWDQQKNVMAQVNKRIAHVMESWLLGHEVGHAILHSATSLDRPRAYTEKQELEADSYFLDRALEGADKQRRQDLSFALSQFIFAVLGIAFNSTNKGVDHGTSEAVIAPSADGIHPPWLIRALNLGERMDEKDHTQNGIFKSLADHVSVKAGGIDIGSLCAFESLRELEAHLQERRLGNPGK